MLNITIIAVGSLKEPWLKSAYGEYLKRFSGLCKINVIDLPQCRLPDDPSPSQIDAALRKEADAILKKIPPRNFITALCVEGMPLSSPDFAKILSGKALSHPGAAFIIGSGYGLHESVKSSANLLMSLSQMTFPHQLARVILLEQLYRCASIQTGGKYHK